MKVNTKEFKTILYNTMLFIEHKSPIPQSTFIKVESNEDSLSLLSLNTSGKNIFSLPLKNNDNFNFYITDPTVFNKIINLIDTEEFDLSINNETEVIVKSNKKKYKIGISIEDYDFTYKDDDYDNEFEDIDFQELSEILKNASLFSANDELRPVMNGVCVNQDHFVSTDSHKLYRKNNTIIKTDKEFIIDKEYIYKLTKIKYSGIITIKLNNKNIKITGENFESFSRVIEGNYPNYKAILPDYNDSVIFDKTDVLNEIKSLSIMSNISEVSLSKDKMNLLSKNVDFNREYTSSLECSLNGKDLRIGLNNDHFKIILDLMKDQILMKYDAPERAVLFYNVNDDDELFLLMPNLLS